MIKKIICANCNSKSEEETKELSGGFKIIKETKKVLTISNCSKCSRI